MFIQPGVFDVSCLRLRQTKINAIQIGHLGQIPNPPDEGAAFIPATVARRYQPIAVFIPRYPVARLLHVFVESDQACSALRQSEHGKYRIALPFRFVKTLAIGKDESQYGILIAQ